MFVAFAYTHCDGNGASISNANGNGYRARWQAVNICTARGGFALAYAGHAQIVAVGDANNFLTHNFDSWRDISANAPDHEVLTSISFKIRVPRVIVLLVFERSDTLEADCFI